MLHFWMMKPSKKLNWSCYSCIEWLKGMQIDPAYCDFWNVYQKQYFLDVFFSILDTLHSQTNILYIILLKRYVWFLCNIFVSSIALII